MKKCFSETYLIESENSDGIEFKIQSQVEERPGISSRISLYYESKLGVTKISAVHNAESKEEWLSMVRHLNLIRDVECCVKYQNLERMETGIIGYIRADEIALFKHVLDSVSTVNSILSGFRKVNREMKEELNWRKPKPYED